MVLPPMRLVWSWGQNQVEGWLVYMTGPCLKTTTQKHSRCWVNGALHCSGGDTGALKDGTFRPNQAVIKGTGGLCPVGTSCRVLKEPAAHFRQASSQADCVLHPLKRGNTGTCVHVIVWYMCVGFCDCVVCVVYVCVIVCIMCMCGVFL